ncbi:hypothetical protein T11_4208 [Trichinella zimbabwensis]|uniref:Uncharacterized protein n=1 Tax=Trichinella zimbabwensis TaxID=268475 RepID=A0A0V1H6X7_9BILA|nr:hypothetical protein T11_4208 [Trichinella zimbabwensis]
MSQFGSCFYWILDDDANDDDRLSQHHLLTTKPVVVVVAAVMIMHVVMHDTLFALYMEHLCLFVSFSTE